MSTEDRFLELSTFAEDAGATGNYAIAAAFVTNLGDQEITCTAHNTIFSRHDPSGHAEMNALRLAAGVGERRDEFDVRVRTVAGEPAGSTLYATLEPCPMCTVAIVNSGLSRVVIAVEDPPSGTMHPDRLAALPPIWRELASPIEVLFCQSDKPDDALTYVPRELLQHLAKQFEDSRVALDKALALTGVIDRSGLLHQHVVR